MPCDRTRLLEDWAHIWNSTWWVGNVTRIPDGHGSEVGVFSASRLTTDLNQIAPAMAQ